MFHTASILGSLAFVYILANLARGDRSKNTVHLQMKLQGSEANNRLYLGQNCYLFVSGGIREANSLDLWAGVACETRPASEPWGCVDAAHTHVTGHHDTLGAQKHMRAE